MEISAYLLFAAGMITMLCESIVSIFWRLKAEKHATRAMKEDHQNWVATKYTMALVMFVASIAARVLAG